MSDEIQWLVHLFFSLLLFLLLSVFCLLAYMLDSSLQLRHQLDHVGHGKLIHAKPPCVFQHKVGSDVLITGVQRGGKELFLFSLDKEPQEILNNFSVI
jgi:hypothetical protein